MQVCGHTLDRPDCRNPHACCRWHLTSPSYTPRHLIAMLVFVTGMMHTPVSMQLSFLTCSMHARPNWTLSWDHTLHADLIALSPHRRMQELRDNEQRATVEDLMYASVLEKFVNLKVEMLPRYARTSPCKCVSM